LSSYRLRSAQDQTPLRQRASGFALAVGINLLVLLMLLGAGVVRMDPAKRSGALVIDFVSEAPEPVPARQKTAKAEQPRPVEEEAQPTLPRVPIPKVVLPPSEPLLYIPMTREEMAAADVRNLPKATAGGGPTGSSDDSEQVGRGPRGEVLYAAQWAREPTNAELAGYLPPGAPIGWGMIACRTVPGNRVDDCVELGNDPPGSRLASAIRQAAWQFRVRPPRKNGKPMIGEWVRIRIEYGRRVGGA
jgi:protein TonB